LFWSRVWGALQRAIAFGIFMAVHVAINRGLEYAVPKRLGQALELAEAITFVFFLLSYVYLAWDMVAIFIPSLRTTAEKEVIKHESEAEQQSERDQ
jgi:hypothetical protein